MKAILYKPRTGRGPNERLNHFIQTLKTEHIATGAASGLGSSGGVNGLGDRFSRRLWPRRSEVLCAEAKRRTGLEEFGEPPATARLFRRLLFAVRNLVTAETMRLSAPGEEPRTYQLRVRILR
jgi:hypothetical protein